MQACRRSAIAVGPRNEARLQKTSISSLEGLLAVTSFYDATAVLDAARATSSNAPPPRGASKEDQRLVQEGGPGTRSALAATGGNSQEEPEYSEQPVNFVGKQEKCVCVRSVR
ncbi:hypothetical protein AGIG_G20828 [Arapaima gigas]